MMPPPPPPPVRVWCPRCHGSGTRWLLTVCRQCGGSGTIWIGRTEGER